VSWKIRVRNLFDKRLLIFTGKGGVGKSTVAAAAAVAAARRGKRVLLVEIGEQERIPSIFESPKKAGYGGASVYTGRTSGSAPIWSMCVTAREALHEFAVHSMKFETLYKAVFENRAVRYFTAAAPGLDELVILGKIEFLLRESRVSAKGPSFDLMIFDAPATGHGLAMFSVPKTAMSMTQGGPLHSKAERMWRLLTDPARTALNLVTLPEDMPVSEAIDLHKAATELGLPRGKVVVNGVYPDFSPDDREHLRRMREHAAPLDGPAARVARAALDRAVSSVVRREAHEHMIDTLARALPHERITLPWLFSPQIGPEDIETLADGLEALQA
jgi:anion-transporting  ArsA/GET3 family ATPase